MLKVQTKNKIDEPTVKESLKELAILSAITGVLYFLTGVQDVNLGEYTVLVGIAARFIIKLIEEYRKGI